jgi:hypothetical protein
MNLHDLTRGIPKDAELVVADGIGGSVQCPLCNSFVPLYVGIVENVMLNSCPNCHASIAVQPAEVPEPKT